MIQYKKGDTYNYITLTGNTCVRKQRRYVEYNCKCGTVGWGRLWNIKNGVIKSCGCYGKEQIIKLNTTHGLSKHPLFRIWKGMKVRCSCPSNKRYPLYGGRGVKVCEEWVNDFKSFYDWAMENNWGVGLELDKDKLAPNHIGYLYSPQYCSFISHKENCKYTSRSRFIEHNGQIKNLTDWCHELNLEIKTTSRRIFNQGWTVDKAFSKGIKNDITI